MGKVKRYASGVSGLGSRPLRVLRAGVEAALLIGVSLGVGQAAWTLVAPGKAGAASDRDGDPAQPKSVQQAELRSPFEPDVAGLDGSHAAAALIGGVQLAGVRTSTIVEKSGAVLVMPDGAQRAFGMGQEIIAGVRLAEVGADYVLLSYPGGKRQISLPAAPAYSFARALMGEAQAAAQPVSAPAPAQPAAAPATVPLAVAPGAPAETAVAAAPATTAWFAAALSRVETFEDGTRGWRLVDPLPDMVAKAGLRAGDLIVSVNGLGPDNPLAIASAAASGKAELTVRRGGERLTIALAGQQPT